MWPGSGSAVVIVFKRQMWSSGLDWANARSGSDWPTARSPCVCVCVYSRSLFIFLFFLMFLVLASMFPLFFNLFLFLKLCFVSSSLFDFCVVRRGAAGVSRVLHRRKKNGIADANQCDLVARPCAHEHVHVLACQPVICARTRVAVFKSFHLDPRATKSSLFTSLFFFFFYSTWNVSRFGGDLLPRLQRLQKKKIMSKVVRKLDFACPVFQRGGTFINFTRKESEKRRHDPFIFPFVF